MGPSQTSKLQLTSDLDLDSRRKGNHPGHLTYTALALAVQVCVRVCPSASTTLSRLTVCYATACCVGRAVTYILESATHPDVYESSEGIPCVLRTPVLLQRVLAALHVRRDLDLNPAGMSLRPVVAQTPTTSRLATLLR